MLVNSMLLNDWTSRHVSGLVTPSSHTGPCPGVSYSGQATLALPGAGGTHRQNSWRVAVLAVVVSRVILSRRRRRRLWMPVPSCRGSRLARGSRGNGDRRVDDSNLPTDEELQRSLAALLPPEVRMAREAEVRAVETLRKADESIAALGVDLQAAERQHIERFRLLQVLLQDGPPLAVCGCLGDDRPVIAALRAQLGDYPALWFDLVGFGELEPEAIQEAFTGCEGLALYPSGDPAQFQAESIGLTSLMKNLPYTVKRVVLLSAPLEVKAEDDSSDGEQPFNPFAAADSFLFGTKRREATPTRPLENILTVKARENPRLGDPPLYITIIRAAVGDTSGPPQVFSRLPATVGDAARSLRTMYIGGIQGVMPSKKASADTPSGTASAELTAAVFLFAVRSGLDVQELSVVGSLPEEERGFEEMLLPLIGPELWRMPVESSSRTRAWVRGWVDFNYCRAGSQSSAALKRVGLRTPIEVREVLNGVCIKFSPSGTRSPGAGFDGLREGGLEIVVDEPYEGQPGRLRVRRCSYGWRIKPKEASERAILSKLRRDWSQSFQTE
mmetsp:Transcript_82265/g.209076  ORF Transcript_82265/g.209076 Transcript_82265/m.209076 type:complete len:557 (+) Transcript_82265:160-1830(+)